MQLPDTNPRPQTEPDQAAEGPDAELPTKAIDFAVDSAGNVSPTTKRKVESGAGRTQPPPDRWSRSS